MRADKYAQIRSRPKKQFQSPFLRVNGLWLDSEEVRYLISRKWQIRNFHEIMYSTHIWKVALFQSEKTCKGYSRLCHNFVVMRCLKLDRMLNNNLVQKSLFLNSVFLLWHGSVGLHTYHFWGHFEFTMVKYICCVCNSEFIEWLLQHKMSNKHTNYQCVGFQWCLTVCADKVKLFAQQKYKLRPTELPSFQ